jgi:triphosphoribosyl-dephospho-CoA synthase
MSGHELWKDGMSIGRLVELACLLEVTASKPGNVHRGADFEDVTFLDFVASAVAMGQAIDKCETMGYGEMVLAVASSTVKIADSNTNLGINLLVSLLVQACRIEGRLNVESVKSCLGKLDEQDSKSVFAAIGLMNPSGMGSVEEHDLNATPPACLIEAMDAAKDRDRIATQFTNGFSDVFEKVLPWIVEGRNKFGDLTQGIVWAHVRMMAEYPDSLIARKCGLAVAEQSQSMAGKVIDAMADGPEAFFSAVASLDFWLRSDGHRRNPGTTADMIAAGLFVGLYNGDITPPFAR